MTLVTIKVAGKASSDEDRYVPGSYEVAVDPDVPGELVATAALDCLHSNVAIAELDDFSIELVDADGEPIYEVENIDTSSLSLEKCAEFLGAVEDVSPKL